MDKIASALQMTDVPWKRIQLVALAWLVALVCAACSLLLWDYHPKAGFTDIHVLRDFDITRALAARDVLEPIGGRLGAAQRLGMVLLNYLIAVAMLVCFGIAVVSRSNVLRSKRSGQAFIVLTLLLSMRPEIPTLGRFGQAPERVTTPAHARAALGLGPTQAVPTELLKHAPPQVISTDQPKLLEEMQNPQTFSAVSHGPSRPDALVTLLAPKIMSAREAAAIYYLRAQIAYVAGDFPRASLLAARMNYSTAEISQYGDSPEIAYRVARMRGLAPPLAPIVMRFPGIGFSGVPLPITRDVIVGLFAMLALMSFLFSLRQLFDRDLEQEHPRLNRLRAAPAANTIAAAAAARNAADREAFLVDDRMRAQVGTIMRWIGYALIVPILLIYIPTDVERQYLVPRLLNVPLEMEAYLRAQGAPVHTTFSEMFSGTYPIPPIALIIIAVLYTTEVLAKKCAPKWLSRDFVMTFSLLVLAMATAPFVKYIKRDLNNAVAISARDLAFSPQDKPVYANGKDRKTYRIDAKALSPLLADQYSYLKAQYYYVQFDAPRMAAALGEMKGVWQPHDPVARKRMASLVAYANEYHVPVTGVAAAFQPQAPDNTLRRALCALLSTLATILRFSGQILRWIYAWRVRQPVERRDQLISPARRW